MRAPPYAVVLNSPAVGLANVGTPSAPSPSGSRSATITSAAPSTSPAMKSVATLVNTIHRPFALMSASHERPPGSTSPACSRVVVPSAMSRTYTCDLPDVLSGPARFVASLVNTMKRPSALGSASELAPFGDARRSVGARHQLGRARERVVAALDGGRQVDIGDAVRVTGHERLGRGEHDVLTVGGDDGIGRRAGVRPRHEHRLGGITGCGGGGLSLPDRGEPACEQHGDGRRSDAATTDLRGVRDHR